jgi:acyl carrier protein
MAESIAMIPPTGITTNRRNATEEAVLGIARNVLGKPALGPDDDLFDHGATSLSFVRVLAQIKQELKVMVRAADLDGEVTARALAANIEKSEEG